MPGSAAAAGGPRNRSLLSRAVGNGAASDGAGAGRAGSAEQLSSSVPVGGPVGPQEALLRLLPVLTSIDGGWWESLERCAVAIAQHLSAAHTRWARSTAGG